MKGIVGNDIQTETSKSCWEQSTAVCPQAAHAWGLSTGGWKPTVYVPDTELRVVPTRIIGPLVLLKRVVPDIKQYTKHLPVGSSHPYLLRVCCPDPCT